MNRVSKFELALGLATNINNQEEKSSKYEIISLNMIRIYILLYMSYFSVFSNIFLFLFVLLIKKLFYLIGQSRGSN